MNKFLIYLVLLFSPDFFGQENDVFLLLEKDNPEYVYFINGEKENHQNLNEAEKFFVTSTTDYSAYLENKKELVKGETDFPFPGLSFKVKKRRFINASDFNNLCSVDFQWLTANARIRRENIIELNAFKNLHLVLRKGEDFIIYDVVREFSSH